MSMTASELRGISFERLKRFDRRDKVEYGEAVTIIVMEHHTKFGGFKFPQGTPRPFLVTRYRAEHDRTGILLYDDQGVYWYRMFELTDDELQYLKNRNFTHIDDVKRQKAAA